MSTIPANQSVPLDVCYFVIQDVFKEVSSRRRVQVGDLFVMQSGIAFVSYSSFSVPSSVFSPKKGLAFAIGGLAGITAVLLGESGEKDMALAKAEDIRRKQWGRTVAQRIPSTFIKKDDIQKFIFGDNGLGILTKQKQHNLGHRNVKRHRKDLLDYLEGKAIQHPDRLGVNINLPAPEDIINSLVHGEFLPLEDGQLEEILNDDIYMKKFWKAYEKRRRPDKLNIYNSFFQYPQRFHHKFKDRINERKKETLNSLLLFASLVGLEIAFFVFYISLSTTGNINNLPYFISFPIAVLGPISILIACIHSVILILTWLELRNYVKILQNPGE